MRQGSILRTSLIWAVLLLGLALVAVMLPACSMFQGVPEKTVVDTFCLTAKKRAWSIDRDPPDRIREARIHNKVIDDRCPNGVQS